MCILTHTTHSADLRKSEPDGVSKTVVIFFGTDSPSPEQPSVFEVFRSLSFRFFLVSHYTDTHIYVFSLDLT